ncbi:transcriptional regulator with XRE-family HTH domain [Neisseria sp. HSC-16F19]|nr:helix-turn-helix domain-containing protein [Neisseria sp. HSC-16F19]MCP2040464.1 transcriptional regulator with XRE-family HTH domain [Neisseria sp. HSC-16F19]
MYSATNWLDMYKAAVGIQSDYKLARKLNLPRSYIAQIRAGRLRLRLATILQIAEELEIEPLEIIVSLEFKKAKPHEVDRLKDWYFKETVKTIGPRMCAQSGARWFRGRK